jgi:hypothetical protein
MNRHVPRSYLYIQALIVPIVILISLVPHGSAFAETASIRKFNSADVLAHAEGVGSLPAVILRDDTVCALSSANPHQCTPLMKVSAKIIDSIAKRNGQFDGLFDLLNDGTPQIFIDYWPASSDANCPRQYQDSDQGEFCDAIVLFVYRQTADGYQPYLALHADSFGYSPGAWFLDESPHKAIFETRCDGSGGDCLYYLNLSKRSLEQIDDTATLQNPPTVEYLGHERNASFFLTNRGYDRLAAQGAVLIHWSGGRYCQWWPDWFAPPYVMYAQMANIDGVSEKEIVAVLDPRKKPDRGSKSRELAVWELNSGGWRLAAKTHLYPVADPDRMVAFPTLDQIKPRQSGTEIFLSNSNGSTFTCRYADRRLTCPTAPSPDSSVLAKPRT